jgi:hypothetical protein
MCIAFIFNLFGNCAPDWSAITADRIRDFVATDIRKHHAEQTVCALRAALRFLIAESRAVGRGALIACGWALVLPRVAAAIHHGGAGTTTAVAGAGVPQVVLPHVLDQYYWARRLERLGLGPRALPVDLVTADVLTERLDRALNDREIRDRAEAFGRMIASRSGVADATDYLEQLIGAIRLSSVIR